MTNPLTEFNAAAQDALFEKIAADLRSDGYSINQQALPLALAQALHQQVTGLSSDAFNRAGVGREQQQILSEEVRRDSIRWIDADSQAGEAWLCWAQQLQQYLNRRLYLGLFSFESHFAHYRPGDYYQRHLDAFRGRSNRVLSMVTYLNPDWDSANGGELVLYRDSDDTQGVKVVPQLGSVAIFLSEEFPHEVLPSSVDRYSIAGWFRVNTSVSSRVDPAQ
ncbi:MAG: 2OG-Fe(II) oxygenase [Pseudomonadales bacterium]